MDRFTLTGGILYIFPPPQRTHYALNARDVGNPRSDLYRKDRFPNFKQMPKRLPSALPSATFSASDKAIVTRFRPSGTSGASNFARPNAFSSADLAGFSEIPLIEFLTPHVSFRRYTAPSPRRLPGPTVKIW